MTARLAILASALLMTASVSAEYLLWQVTPTSQEGSTAIGDFTYTGVRIGYYTSDKSKANYGEYTTASSGSFDLSQLNANPSEYSFFIELVNYDNGTYTPVAYSESQTYSQLANSVYKSKELSVDPATYASAWHGGSFTAAPEPTSAVLMAFGLAILGLKRRKC